MKPYIYEAGFGEQTITPPVGTPLAGFFHERIARRIRDDLHARAVTIGNGRSRVALVSLELVCVDSDFVDKAKALIAERTGLSPDHVMITATHTHTGPEVRLFGNKVSRDDAWLATLPSRIADVVEQALQHQVKVSLRIGRVKTEGYVYNRLFKRKDGTEQMGRGGSRRDVLGPAGPVDPDLLTLSLVDESGTVRGILFNVNVHGGPTVGGGKADFISADWPGDVVRHLRLIYGAGALPVYLQGACGDTWPQPCEDRMRPQNGPDKALALGRGLAGAAAYGAERAEPETTDCVAVRVRHVDIPYYTRTPELMAEVARLKQSKDLDPTQAFFVEAVETWPFDGKICRVPLQVLRIADLALIAVPAQIFTRIALEMKRWSPAPHTMVVELCNARVTSYVPTADQVERGAYGSRPIISRWLSADAGRRMTDTVIAMLHDLWNEGTVRDP